MAVKSIQQLNSNFCLISNLCNSLLQDKKDFFYGTIQTSEGNLK